MIGRLLHRAFRANETAVHELNYLFWECTTRCNLHCRHCGSDCFAASRDVDMPLEDFLRALDTIPAAERANPFTVILTGGEPLLRPDIADIGKALRGRGVGWSIVSNGWFYDEAMHRKLMTAGLGALTISLDGLEESHDWMRGRPGSFSRAERAIALAAAEPRLAFDVVTCVNKRNFKELDAIHDRLQALGVKQWRIFTIIPIGRAAEDPEMHLSDEEFTALMEFIAKKRKEIPGKARVTFSCEGYLGRYENKVRDVPFFCHAGVNIASVLIDGRICACPNIDRDVFSQGSIYEDDFYEVWQNRFQPFRDRGWTRRGRCAQCPVWRDCLGNGMHNWHGDCAEVLNCHYGKII
ncbi:MAG: TIGR04133 family radical SAM/SPASM protein [Bacteroidales bacterium]|nr:TIGR04133 family radical SAM/SPASM protein [Bacteroidales bacterium]